MKLSNVSVFFGATALPAAILLTAPGQVAAQQSASAAAMLEEVVVTARRREESLADLPLSVAAVTADAMQAQGIYDIMDVSDAIPNLSFQNTGRRGITAIFIRGVGSARPISLAPTGTGTYIDGHYLPNTVGNMLSTVDVERIEVLRGPQGTLFGKNTTGGAINVISVKPQQEFGADFLMRMGDFGRNDMRGMLNIPFSDTVAARFAIAKETADGHWYNRIREEMVDGTDLEAYNAALRFTPNDNWTIDLSVRSNSQDDGQDGGQCALAITPGQAATHGWTGPGIDPNGVSQWGGGSYGGLGHVERLYPGAQIDQWNACLADEAAGEFVTSSNRDTFFELDIKAVNATTNWDSNGPVGGLDNLAVKFIASTTQRDVSYVQDRDYTWLGIDSIGLAPLSGDGQLRDTENMEVLATLDFSDSLSAIVGMNLYEDLGYDGDLGCLKVINANFAQISDPAQADTFSITCAPDGGTQFDRLTNNPTGGGPGPVGKGGLVTNESIAFFGHVTWDLSDNWTLDLGARWTEDERSFNNAEYDVIGCEIEGENQPRPIGTALCVSDYTLNYDAIFGGNFYNDLNATFDEVTPMVSITRHLGDDSLVYATYSTGFLSGSFNDELNSRLVPQLAPLQTYQPETVTNYELGYKGTIADGRVRIAADIFYMDYADKHEGVNIDNSDLRYGNDTDLNITTNAATVEITGIEFELRASLWDGGFFGVDVGYIDDKYGDFFSFNIEDPSSPIDLTNTSRQTYSPEWTMNGSVEHAFQLANGASLTPMLGLYYQSEYDFTQALVDSPPSKCHQPGYSKLRARLTYVDPSENWQASLYGYNIADERYFEWCGNSRSGTFARRWGPPQEWGVEFNYTF